MSGNEDANRVVTLLRENRERDASPARNEVANFLREENDSPPAVAVSKAKRLSNGTDSESTTTASRQTQSHHPPVLIIAEDDADDFRLLKRALWKAGATARVWWAHDAQEALTILATVEPSTEAVCIVSDVRLLGLDGFALLQRVKSRETSCQVKFAVLTGMCDRVTEIRAHALGADAFFIKPSDPEQLIQIARALQKLVTG